MSLSGWVVKRKAGSYGIGNERRRHRGEKEKKSGDDGSQVIDRSTNSGDLAPVTTTTSDTLSVTLGHYGHLAHRSYHQHSDYLITLHYVNLALSHQPQPTTSHPYELLLLRAKAHYKLKDYRATLSDCKKVWQVTKKLGESYVMATHCHLQLKDYERALKVTQVGLKYVDRNQSEYQRLSAYHKKLLTRQPTEVKLVPLTKSQTWVQTIPLELLLRILDLVDRSDISTLMVTCKAWNHALTRLPLLWKDIHLNFSLPTPKLAKAKLSSHQHYAELTLQTHLHRANTRLERITLSHSPKLDWRWFKSLQSCPRPRLKELQFHHTTLSLTFLTPALATLGNQVTHLTLSHCKVTNELVATVLAHCPSLSHLDLAGNGNLTAAMFYDPFDRPLNPHPSLRWVGLAETRPGPTVIAALSRLTPHLTGVNLNQVGSLHVRDLSTLVEKLPNVTDLALAGLQLHFGDRAQLLPSFALFGAHFQLTRLDLSRNPFVDDRVVSCLRHLPALRYLNLAYTSVSTPTTSLLTGVCLHLEELSLASCMQIQDEALLALTSLLPLRTLDLSGLRFTTAALHHLATTFHATLTTFHLISCPTASATGLTSWLTRPPPLLRHLDLTHFPTITTAFLSQLRRSLPHVRIVHRYPL